jgi:SHS2 domain-containing protein
MPPFEIFDHTADIGLKISGCNYEEFLTHAAEGLMDVMTDTGAMKKIHADPATRLDITLEAADAGELLLKWLRELLFYFSSRRWMLNHFEFQKLTETSLHAKASGIRFDPDRFDQRVEVKAVTYHAFEIQKLKNGAWSAQVVLDI